MIFREETIQDIPQIQVVRSSVTEHTLSKPNAVKDIDVEGHLTQKGKGRVCKISKDGRE